MNMKEKLRVEIRKGLKELEMRCKDMPSLLHGLGIHVGGSLIPLPNEASCVYLLFFNDISLSTSLCILDSAYNLNAMLQSFQLLVILQLIQTFGCY